MNNASIIYNGAHKTNYPTSGKEDIMQVNNYLTDLLDLGITKSWKEINLEPGKIPFVIESTGKSYLLSGQPSLTTEELASYLDALGLPEYTPAPRPSARLFYKSDAHAKKIPFHVYYESLQSRILGQPGTFSVKFKPLSDPQPWNPEEES